MPVSAQQVAPDLNALDPRVTDLVLDLLMNFMTLEAEQPFFFTAEEFDYDDLLIARFIGKSMDEDKVVRFREGDYPKDRILSGFECAAQDLAHEIGLIAWTDGDDDEVFRYIAASGGTASRVGLPVEVALPKLLARAAAGTPTKVLVVHNHPRHPVKELFEEAFGVAMGPSGTDRRTMWSWALKVALASGFTIEPMFLLYESGEWRRFRWPAVGQILEWIAMASGR